VATIVAAIKGVDPDITLQTICDRLEAMRGRTRWQPSAVRMLLDRADALEHVAQKWEPVLRSSDVRYQKVGVGRENANERDTL